MFVYVKDSPTRKATVERGMNMKRVIYVCGPTPGSREFNLCALTCVPSSSKILTQIEIIYECFLTTRGLGSSKYFFDIDSKKNINV